MSWNASELIDAPTHGSLVSSPALQRNRSGPWSCGNATLINSADDPLLLRTRTDGPAMDVRRRPNRRAPTPASRDAPRRTQGPGDLVLRTNARQIQRRRLGSRGRSGRRGMSVGSSGATNNSAVNWSSAWYLAAYWYTLPALPVGERAAESSRASFPYGPYALATSRKWTYERWPMRYLVLTTRRPYPNCTRVGHTLTSTKFALQRVRVREV